MTSTKYRVLFWFFSIFLAFSFIVFVLASPTHNVGSQIGVNYEAPVGVNLNFVNNTGSDVVSDAYEIRYNEDITQFYIEGIVPSSATYQDGRIINDKGQEFYYFSNVPQDDNGNVIGNAGEGTSTSQNSLEENVNLNDGVSTLEDSFVNIPENKNILAKRYYPSSSTDPIWYDLPETDIELYSTFLTPNCTDGTKATIGTNTDIVISHQVTSIPNDAFEGSSSTSGVVTSVVIPNGVETIGQVAFGYNYTLSNVVLPSTLTTINTYAFYYCYGLTNITVPQKVNSIGGSAFYSNEKLIEVNNLSSLSISTNNSFNGYIGRYAEEVFDSINYDSKLKLSDDGLIMYENVGDSIYHAMGIIGGKDASVILPTTSYDYDIYEDAFVYNDNIVSVEISSSVTSIGSSAFRDCSSLTSIKIPSGVTSIRYEAFENCSSLETVTFGENSQLVTIDGLVFSGCSSLTSITIPRGVTSIGDFLFEACSSLTSITIPEGVTSIGESAFEDCSSLTSITIPEGVTSIRYEAFRDCSSLTSITIPSGVTEIESNTFYNCSNLESVDFGDNSQLASIWSYAFYNCSSLKSVNLPEGITRIYDYTFYCCSSLTSITIPESVTRIGGYAFNGCSNIQELHIDDVTNYLNISYSNSYSKPLYETNQNVSLYVNGELATDIVILDSVTEIPSYAFNRVTNITSVTIPSSVTSIEYYAFYNCSSLESVDFGENSQLASIGSPAFEGCSSLTSITIPDSVTSIGSSAFDGCSSLETVTFGENSQLTSIGSNAFNGCSSLTSITIPSGVTSIESSAFYGCSSLTSIIIPDSVTSIGGYVFRNCSNLSIYFEAEDESNITLNSNWNYSNCPVYWAGEWEMVDGVPVPIESGVEGVGYSDIGKDFGIGFDGLGFREEIYFNDKRERKEV